MVQTSIHRAFNQLIERMIAIDGKTSRGSKDGFHALLSVNTWSVENGICLGQIVDESRWEKLTSMIKITSIREFASGKKEMQERYYISLKI